MLYTLLVVIFVLAPDGRMVEHQWRHPTPMTLDRCMAEGRDVAAASHTVESLRGMAFRCEPQR